MRKTLAALGFLSSLLVCAQANATITVTSGPLAPIFLGSLETFDGVTTGTSANGPGFSTSFGGGATFTGDGLVTNSAATNAYAQPFFPPGVKDLTNYLAVGGNEFSGATTIAFASSHDVFGLYWGSVDAYNTIIFENNGVALVGGTFTGSDVAPGLQATGSQNCLNSNGYVVFSGLGTFNEVVLQTSTPNFEIDNLEIELRLWLAVGPGDFNLGNDDPRLPGRWFHGLPPSEPDGVSPRLISQARSKRRAARWAAFL